MPSQAHPADTHKTPNADSAYTRFMEGRVVARPESLVMLHEGVYDGIEACVSRHASRHDVCDSTEPE